MIGSFRQTSHGVAMRLKDWEATIQQIVDESNLESREVAKRKVLTTWRRNLEKEPTSLPPFQIDEIMREVRTRLTSVKDLPRDT
jgi:hypothetical protein